MKKRFIRILAVLLTITLLIQIMPVGAVSERTQTKRMLRSLTPVPAARGMAAGRAATGPDALSIDDSELSATPIIGEAQEFRDESTKHFRHVDSTFTAAIYPEPVHFLGTDGRWLDIDNRLLLNSEKRSATGEATYTPAASGLDIRFPQDFTNDQQLTIGKDGYTVGLGVIAPRSSVQPKRDIPDDEGEPPVTEEITTAPAIEETTVVAEEPTTAPTIEETTAPVAEQPTTEPTTTTPPVEDTTVPPSNRPDPVEPPEETALGLSAVKAEVDNDYAARTKTPNEEKADTIEAANAKKMEVGNLSSAVTYRDIFPGADLEYIVTPTKIKENIWVKEPQASYIYKFHLSLGGLIPVPQEDGSIYLLKNAADTEPLFILQAPYMYDAAGVSSTALKMDLAADGTLTLSADAAWINAEGRAFPVVIDPTLVTSTSSIPNVTINTNEPDTNSVAQLYVGNSDDTVYRTYFYFWPSLPGDCIVTKAVFEIGQLSIDDTSGGNQLFYMIAPHLLPHWDMLMRVSLVQRGISSRFPRL